MELQNNSYFVGSVALLPLAEQFGTPLYVYDGDHIQRQYRRLKSAFGPRASFKYACKSNTNLNILRLLREEGAGLDAVSIQEVQLGLAAGFAPHQILFTPNCVSLAEVEQGVDLGVHINIDNISLLEQFGHRFGNAVPVCVRLNPHVMAGGNAHIQTGHIDSKFGISIHQMRHLTRVVKANNIRVEGLHMHTGSDIIDAEVFLNAAEVLYNAASHFQDLRYLDFGSGFKVAYRQGDVTTDVEELGHRVAQSFEDFCAEYGRELELWFEPGKFLVSQGGYFLVRTNVVKTTVSTVFAGVDSGLNHLIRPMFYDAYHDIVNISHPEGTQRVYDVVGYICETDTFGYDRKLNEVREGDILALCNAGAYCFSMASNYNSRLRPAEVLILDGQAHLIRQRETFEDLLRNQVEIPALQTATDQADVAAS